jgi:hypothetical protein
MMPGRSGVRRWLLCWGPVGAVVWIGPAEPASAAGPLQPLSDWVALVTGSRQHELFSSIFVIGLLIFALTTAITHVRARAVWQRSERELRAGNETLGARAERAEALLFSEPQLIAVWARSASMSASSAEVSEASTQPRKDRPRPAIGA